MVVYSDMLNWSDTFDVKGANKVKIRSTSYENQHEKMCIEQ
jgi:hypothetical protein